MTFLELVIRDPWAQVVDVMETDIACEPLQQLGKLVERAAVHAGVEELPLRMALPVGGVEIVLHVKEPDSRAAGDQQNRDLDQQESCPTNFEHEPADEWGDRDIGPDHTTSFAFARVFFEKALCHRKNDERPDGK